MRYTVAVTFASTFLLNTVAASSYYPYIVPSSPVHHVNAIAATTTSPSLSCTTPDPWPFKCDITGNLTTPTQDDPPTPIDSLDDCRDLCINNRTCSAFGYDDFDGTCMILLKSLRANGLVAIANATTAYWHRNCFLCTTVTPTPATPAPNVITNGDFSTGDLTNWTTGSPAVEPGSSADTTSGVTSLPPPSNQTTTFFATLTSPSQILYLSQLLPTTPNTTYAVSFSYMVANAGVQQAIYVLAGTDDQVGGYEFFAPPDAFVAGEWSVGRGVYVAQGNGTFGFVMSASAGQTFYIDDVVVTVAE